MTAAAETKRLARIAELARAGRRAERALERAIRAANERGIGVRRIADAAGMSPQTVWRIARPPNGHEKAATRPQEPASRHSKRDPGE